MTSFSLVFAGVLAGVLALCAVVALCVVCGAAAGWGWAVATTAVYGRRQRRRGAVSGAAASKAPRRHERDPLGVEYDRYWDTARAVLDQAVQEVAAPATVPYTAVMPQVSEAGLWSPPTAEPAAVYMAEARHVAAYAMGESGVTGRWTT